MTAVVVVPTRAIQRAGDETMTVIGRFVDEAIDAGATFTEERRMDTYATTCTIDGGDPLLTGRLTTALTALAREADEVNVILPMLLARDA